MMATTGTPKKTPPSKAQMVKKIKEKLPHPVYRDLYDLDNVAETLSMSRRMVERLVAGKVAGMPALETIQCGRSKRISRTLLDEWLAKVESKARGRMP